VAVPGAAEAVGAFADLAVARGARRLVLLSGRGEDGALASERALSASGADWTIVRSAFMDQNFDQGFFLEPVRAGEVAFPAHPDLAEPFIDADDIADVAVAALTSDRHIGRLDEVTGPGCSAGRQRSPRSPPPAAARSAMCRSRWRTMRPCWSTSRARPST
jgi:uncharacterized protein YbjT (DUF2867 family)